MTKKITLFRDDIKDYFLKLTEEKQIGSYGSMEKALLLYIKKHLADNNIEITMNTAYFLCCKFFKTNRISKWDKTKYSELAKYSTLKKLIDSNKLKIESMPK